MQHLLYESLADSTTVSTKKILLLSINPDLKSDFGHYLNYEKRINSVCRQAEVYHHCLANIGYNTNCPYISSVFTLDSGHYCLYRKSAEGNELEITTDLHTRIINWLESQIRVETFDSIVIFIYMSSSKSAAMLSCLQWPSKVSVICNSFWDFLSKSAIEDIQHIARIELQDTVRLLSLSKTHSEIINGKHGHHLVYIRNPPPLADDRQFYEILRTTHMHKMLKCTPRIQVLMPSLMTMGKGLEFTREFLQIVPNSYHHILFAVRDRKKELEDKLSCREQSNINFLCGDFSDSEIRDFYSQSHIAILPYSTDTFHHRTSGALVDCLMTSTIPIVFPNTWLSDMCSLYNFGIIAKEESVDAVLSAMEFALTDIRHQLVRNLEGAMHYMSDNNWGKFLKVILGAHLDCETSTPMKSSVPHVSCTDVAETLKFTKLLATARHAKPSLSGFAKAPRESPTLDAVLSTLVSGPDLVNPEILIKTVTSYLIANPNEIKSRLKENPVLQEALARSLDLLPNNTLCKILHRHAIARLA